MTDTTGKFTLKNSAELYPEAGFEPGDDHFAVLLDGQGVGVIYRIEDEWIWAISLSMMGSCSGRTDSRRAAREAFRAAWDEQATRLGPAHVARALAVATGRST